MRHGKSDTASNAEEASGLREARESVMLTAEVRRSGNPTTTKHLLRDLSSRGARLNNAGSFRAGETILVSVGDLQDASATIVWASNETAGLRFSEAIDPALARAKAIVKTFVLKRPFPPKGATPERNA